MGKKSKQKKSQSELRCGLKKIIRELKMQSEAEPLSAYNLESLASQIQAVAYKVNVEKGSSMNKPEK